MKMLYAPLLILFLCLGCAADNFRDDTVQATGTMEKLEVSYFMYGTHVLRSQGGDILYALKSGSQDLAAFENRKVTITGTRIEGYPVSGGPEYLEVIQVREEAN
jgi:hypothetical protein